MRHSATRQTKSPNTGSLPWARRSAIAVLLVGGSAAMILTGALLAPEWRIFLPIPGLIAVVLLKLATAQLVNADRADRTLLRASSAFATTFAAVLLFTLAALFATLVPKIVSRVAALGDLAGGSVAEILTLPGGIVIALCTTLAIGLIAKEPYLQEQRREGLGFTINLAVCLALGFFYVELIRAALEPVMALMREIQ